MLCWEKKNAIPKYEHHVRMYLVMRVWGWSSICWGFLLWDGKFSESFHVILWFTHDTDDWSVITLYNLRHDRTRKVLHSHHWLYHLHHVHTDVLIVYIYVCHVSKKWFNLDKKMLREDTFKKLNHSSIILL